MKQWGPHPSFKPINNRINLLIMSEHERLAYIEKIQIALNDIRPHLNVDGGDIEIIELTDDLIVKIKWTGACESCSMSAMTMKAGVEATVIRQVPEIKGIIALNGIAI